MWGVPGGAVVSPAQFQVAITAAAGASTTASTTAAPGAVAPLSCTAVSSAVNGVNSGTKYSITGFDAGLTSIGDGGGDMYDSGNTIAVNGDTITYVADGAGSAGGTPYNMVINAAGITVTTFANVPSPGGLTITGNLGADGSGSKTHGSYSTGGWNGFWTLNSGAGDPSLLQTKAAKIPAANNTFVAKPTPEATRPV